jgi:Ca-activated chloride channel family protein
MKLIVLMMFINTSLQAQLKTITGVVSDETGPLPGVSVVLNHTNIGTETDFDGQYSIEAEKGQLLIFSYVGYEDKKVKVGEESVIDIEMTGSQLIETVVVTAIGVKRERKRHGYSITKVFSSQLSEGVPGSTPKLKIRGRSSKVSNLTITQGNTESYKDISENDFKLPQNNPLSTFSIDVDKASYSNVRRMINNGIKIPKDAVKIEEMINYFHYDYPQPTGDHPFAIHTEFSDCPWNKKHELVKIGLQGKTIASENLPDSNLVFLIDVSGSMSNYNKLPLLKSAFKLLVNQLRENDKVYIVVYAGAAGVVLEPTSGENKTKIIEALNQLEAGGSTAGGAGIKLAYKLAKENFNKKANNRVILATDGDFNVGLSSDEDMETLIEKERNSGIFLSVLGFGMGNYKDSKLEILADKGNGNHAYIDTMQEAQRVFGQEFGGTLFTIAKDVKIQVEFNPKKVQAYRLIGYENRLLNDEDFINDKIDAGEIGSGHQVTALYEIIPMGVKSKFTSKLPKLKYSTTRSNSNSYNNELLTVKFRYKKPDADKSIEFEKIVPYQ